MLCQKIITTLANNFLEDTQWVMKGEGTNHLLKEGLREMKVVLFPWNEPLLQVSSREAITTSGHDTGG